MGRSGSLGFLLVVLLALMIGWAMSGGHGTTPGGYATSSMSQADLEAALAQPALVWPNDTPDPMTNYVGRRVQAFGLQVTSVDADEGFWVAKDGRSAWVQLQTSTESPYTVRPGDVVSLNGIVLPHDAQYPSGLYFCPDRQASAARLAEVPTHIAVKVQSLSFGVG